MKRKPVDDPLGMLDTQRPRVVSLGSADLSNALRGGRIHQALDSRGEVELTLEIAALPPEPVDYLAPLTYRSQGSGVRANFVGHVRHAEADGTRIHLKAFGASLLTEHTASIFTAFAVPHFELVYVMARAAGMSDEDLVIGGLDELEPEIFEVIAPLRGVAVDAPQAFAGLTFLPADDVTPRLAAQGFDQHLDEMRASAFAISLQTATLGYAAEQAGVRDIDAALDWLAARLQHGLAVLPDGTAQTFDRVQRLARPQRGELIVIRGLKSGRRWVRSASPEGLGSRVALNSADPLLDITTHSLNDTERLALAGVRRATLEREPLARVQALWEAIECLVAGAKAPRQWDRAQLRAIKNSIPGDLPAALRVRAEKAIDDLNQSPLMARFRNLVEREDLPVSDAEIALLQAVRKVRNDAVHGRPATAPPPAQLDYATAVVGRLVIERLSRRVALAKT